MTKIRVGVVFGGKSSEHEVSLQSAKNIINAIDKNKFDVVLLGVDKQGQWYINDPSDYLLNEKNPAKIALKNSEIPIAIISGRPNNQLIETNKPQAKTHIDVVFPIIHGTYGEDGALQGLLKMADIPYVGCDILSSAVCMDKDVCKRLLREAKISVAPSLTLMRHDKTQPSFDDAVAQLGSIPLFVKPANQGSSVGVSKVETAEEYSDALKLAFQFDRKILVEKGVVGREIECAILGNDNPKASVCGEIVVSKGFYSYDSKYIDSDAAKVVVPALIEERVHEVIQKTALAAYKALGCSGMARVDVFLTPNNEVIVNEINTLPGFTNISMYPKMWQASGLGYSELITKLIELAIEYHNDTY